MNKKLFWILFISSIIFISILLLLDFSFFRMIDLYGSTIQNLFSYSGFRTFFLIVTNIMSAIGILVILGMTVYFLRGKQAKIGISLYIISIIGCFIITNLVKILIKRARPLEMLLDVPGFSFPSSHSSISVVVYGYLIILLNKYYYGKWKKFYIILCLLFILLTGLSRIYFGVHYITDVIGGFSLGVIFLCIDSLLLKKLTNTITDVNIYTKKE